MCEQGVFRNWKLSEGSYSILDVILKLLKS